MVRRAGPPLKPLILLALLTACGSSTPTPLRSSPEPAHSPPVTGTPPGTVVALDADQPEGVVVTPDGQRIVVAARRPGELLVVPTADVGSAPTVIPTDGAARHLQLDGADVLVPGEDTATLSVIDPVTGQVVQQAPVGRHPHDAAPVGDEIAVTEEDGRAVSIVRAGEVVARITGPDTPGGIAVTGDRVGAVAVRGRLLYVIDVPRARLVGTVAIGAGPTHVIAIGPGLLAVADTTGDQVIVVATTGEPRVVGRTRLAGRPYGMAVDPQRHLLWVSTTADNRLHPLTIDGSRLTPGPGTPTVRQPNSLAVVPATGDVVVVGATHPGALQVVSGSSSG